MRYRVTGEFCVEGNPTKAWIGTTGEDDTEHVPDDVWQAQTHEFDDLDAAKEFVRGLHPQMSTHVAIESSEDGAEWEMIFYQDSDADHLDDAAPGVPLPSAIDATGGPGEQIVDETLTPYPAQ